MRRLWRGAAVCLVFGIVTTVQAQQANPLRGSVNPQKMEFKPIDTSKAIAPIPKYGQPKQSFLSSLVPSWLKPGNSAVQPTSMRALKRPGAQNVNTNSAAAFQPSQPFKPQQ